MRVMARLRAAVVMTLAFVPALAGAQSTEAMFPFVLPWDDATPGVIDLSGMLAKPAGKAGHVHAGADGHLYTGDTRIRFYGVDLAFDANFPTHEQADKIAARMAKFGINIVRFHIMDMQPFPRGIFLRGSKGTRELDPEALDRLDYFRAQLAQRGIYTNLCLLNYRPINAEDGLPPEIVQPEDNPYQRRHVVGFFDDRVVELQKEYARQLLTHRNPYTGKTPTEDPAVAFVEINNENGLIHAWLAGSVDKLAPVFRDELARAWNGWLKRKYGTAEKLRAAWSAGERPAGPEAIANGDFARQLEKWSLEVHEPAQATAQVVDVPAGAMPLGKAVQISVARPGTQDWHIRLQQPGVAVEVDRACTISFWAKADKPAKISVSVDQSREPWHVLAGRAPVRLGTQWQKHELTLPIKETDGNARMIVDAPTAAATVWISGISLHMDGTTALPASENLGNIPAFTTEEFGRRTASVQRDWMSFLWDTEDHYWQTMYRYLKDDLKVQAPVIGTVVGCSTPNLMAKLDAVDSHAYWQHPQFPGRAWDQNDWVVHNQTMVNETGGILASLAYRRVLGKPFCITEYGNAAPNTYVAEGHLLRSAYASLQDWDYISASRYSHSGDWDIGRIRNFFDIDQHPTKMATMIPAAVMYLRGDVLPAKQLVVATIDREQELSVLRHAQAWDLVHAGHAGVKAGLTLTHRVAIAADGMSVPPGALRPDQVTLPEANYISDTEQLTWDLRQAGRGVVTVDSPHSKAVIGFGQGKHFDLSGVAVDPGPTLQQGWSVITVTAMEGELAKPPCRVLITATGSAENTNMGWKNPQKSSVGKDWGRAPSLVEGIPARITLPVRADKVSAWSLDERGQRKSPLPAQADPAGNAVITIGPEHRTIWYEVAVR